MDDAQPNLSGLYRVTSIARPIDPAYLTNRALLVVLPVLAVLSAGLASLGYLNSGPLAAAFGGALVAFAAWALTRELAPDYDGIAFVALAFSWVANVAFGMQQVLLVFVALVVVRVVNRSTGLAARPFDTLSVFGFCTWTALSTQQPLLLLAASVAFLLDAILEDPLRRHYLAAAACLGVFGWMVLRGDALVANDLAISDWSLLGALGLGVVLVALTSPDPVSYCDTSPKRLNRARVNAGLVLGWLLAAQTLVTKGHPAWLETPIWVCIVVVLFSGVMRRAKRRPA